MRTLFLGSGSSIHVRRPLMQLLLSGIEVILADETNPLPEGWHNYKYVWYPLFGKCIYRKLGHLLGDYLALYTFVPLLRRIQQKYMPDITHVHWVDCHAYYCTLAGLKPLVLSVWGSDINNCFLPSAEPGHSMLVGQALGKAERVIIDDPHMAEKCNLLAGKVIQTELAHLGVDTDLFHPGYHTEANRLREKLRIPQDASILLSMRALAPIYRQEIILEAFAQARIGLKKPAYLVLKIYNQLTPRYKSFLEKRIHELGISDYVRWIEGIPDLEIPTLYALSDAVINFPTADTFPVTFLEAAACECPVITCALPGYENTFVERYFRMVQTDRKEDLSQAIIAELNQESHSRHQLSGARLEVIEHYSESIYITRLLAIYESLR